MGGGIDGLGNVLGGRGRYVDTVAAIVLGGCANVPSVNAVTGPGLADVRGFMEKYSIVGWCKRRAIEILVAVELVFSVKARVDAVRPE